MAWNDDLGHDPAYCDRLAADTEERVEEWEHSLQTLTSEVNWLSEHVLTLTPHEARLCQRALQELERKLMDVVNDVSDRMEEE